MSTSFSNSYIYHGKIIHRRFTPKAHSFDYTLYMLAIDLDDIEKTQKTKQGIGIFGFSWFYPLRFMEKDYVKGEPYSLSERIRHKVERLSGHTDISKIVMLVQVRCFGLYFSPANFYFCYDEDDNCTQMLAEVSNTPWNERHYYLVNLLDENKDKTSKKVFQVSPFMDLAMTYFWHVNPPSSSDDSLLVKIENKVVDKDTGDIHKIFDASLVMKKKPFTKKSLLAIWCQLPVMTMKAVLGIYWQALKLFVKRIPFIGYQKPN
jgi:DUF1365 family protein